MVSPELPVFDDTDAAIRLLEEERRRIARDLHDGPAQSLTNVSMRLDVIARLMQSNPEMALNEISRTNSRVVAAINDIRRLIYDLRPVAIDEIGLISATRELLRRSEQDWHIQFHLHVNPEVTDDFAPAKQVILYRLIQEVIHNAKKHAEAQNVKVDMARDGNQIVIEIQDDGKGFDPEIIPHGHYGIIGMRERAQFLRGSLDIQSELGKGSTFIIKAPVY